MKKELRHIQQRSMFCKKAAIFTFFRAFSPHFSKSALTAVGGHLPALFTRLIDNSCAIRKPVGQYSSGQ